MDPSSTAARAPGERVARRSTTMPASVREYRRDRQHLYPLEDYQDAAAASGTVRSFCGIEVALIGGDSSGGVEAIRPDPEDCITCVDIWRDRRLVRL
jgi:hypothetical protein